MDSQRTSLFLKPPPNSSQRANTANIYAAYAGVVPGSVAQDVKVGTRQVPPNLLWDEDRIESTINRNFIFSQLRLEDQGRLDQKLEFGVGLTDDTYLEWIMQKAKRIFLILVDIGLPDQIFGVVNDCWDDEDLPIPLDQVERLHLTCDRDEKLERSFFQRQFDYLLRYVHPEQIVIYDDMEVVPVESVDNRPTVGPPNGVERVYMPGKPDDFYVRRRIPLGNGPGKMSREEFLSSVEKMKAMGTTHLVGLWASYIHLSVGYILLTPVAIGTLKSFLTTTPPSIKILIKQDRRILLLNWLYCLSTALSSLHSQGRSHGRIQPSNILLDIDNTIYLGESDAFSQLSNVRRARKSFDKESYDYASPEDTLGPFTTAGESRLFPAWLPTSSSGSNSLSLHFPTPNPLSFDFSASYVDPQKSDIFSLACIILDILTILLKRSSRSFASHRSARNRSSGRGNSLPDSSFHKNSTQLESWIFLLRKDTSKKEDQIFRGVNAILDLVARMLSQDPVERPTAAQVRDRLSIVLNKICGIHLHGLVGMHCAPQMARGSGTAVQDIKGTKVDSSSRGHVHGATSFASSGADAVSITSRRSSRSGTVREVKRESGSGSRSGDGSRTKAKAWQAPVYAEISFAGQRGWNSSTR